MKKINLQEVVKLLESNDRATAESLIHEWFVGKASEINSAISEANDEDEDLEEGQLDELSTDTLKSYASKARKVRDRSADDEIVGRRVSGLERVADRARSERAKPQYESHYEDEDEIDGVDLMDPRQDSLDRYVTHGGSMLNLSRRLEQHLGLSAESLYFDDDTLYYHIDGKSHLVLDDVLSNPEYETVDDLLDVIPSRIAEIQGGSGSLTEGPEDESELIADYFREARSPDKLSNRIAEILGMDGSLLTFDDDDLYYVENGEMKLVLFNIMAEKHLRTVDAVAAAAKAKLEKLGLGGNADYTDIDLVDDDQYEFPDSVDLSAGKGIEKGYEWSRTGIRADVAWIRTEDPDEASPAEKAEVEAMVKSAGGTVQHTHFGTVYDDNDDEYGIYYVGFNTTGQARTYEESATFEDLDEAFDGYNNVVTDKLGGKEGAPVGNGASVKVNTKSTLPSVKGGKRIAGEPVAIKGKNHNGYAREKAETAKEITFKNKKLNGENFKADSGKQSKSVLTKSQGAEQNKSPLGNKKA